MTKRTELLTLALLVGMTAGWGGCNIGTSAVTIVQTTTIHPPGPQPVQVDGCPVISLSAVEDPVEADTVIFTITPDGTYSLTNFGAPIEGLFGSGSRLALTSGDYSFVASSGGCSSNPQPVTVD